MRSVWVWFGLFLELLRAQDVHTVVQLIVYGSSSLMLLYFSHLGHFRRCCTCSNIQAQ